MVPVVDWLLDTWRALSGQAPPRTARVLLTDDLEGWPGRPVGVGAVRSWTRLRVAVLGAVWRVRFDRQGHHGGASCAPSPQHAGSSRVAQRVCRPTHAGRHVVRRRGDVRRWNDTKASILVEAWRIVSVRGHHKQRMHAARSADHDAALAMRRLLRARSPAVLPELLPAVQAAARDPNPLIVIPLLQRPGRAPDAVPDTADMRTTVSLKAVSL